MGLLLLLVFSNTEEFEGIAAFIGGLVWHNGRLD